MEKTKKETRLMSEGPYRMLWHICRHYIEEKKACLPSLYQMSFLAVFHAFYRNQRAVLGNSHRGNLLSIGEPCLGIQGVHQLE